MFETKKDDRIAELKATINRQTHAALSQGFKIKELGNQIKILVEEAELDEKIIKASKVEIQSMDRVIESSEILVRTQKELIETLEKMNP